MSEPTFPSIYPALDPGKSQIRLIYLQPRQGSDSDNIVCSLQLADLDDETCTYDALSYEWGDATESPFSIVLNGVETSVRENLWQALRSLSDEQTARLIWIDALCINQKDDSERSSQVRQMGRIYQRASCVIAWLGSEEEVETSIPTATQEAIHLAELLYGTSESTRYHYRPEAGYWRHYQYALPATAPKRTNVPIKYHHPGWAALLAFCQKSYWARLWILQELVLASRITIRTGRLQLNWAALEHIHRQISSAKHLGGNNQRLNYYAQITRSNKMVEDLSGTVPFKILQQRVARKTIGHELYTLFELVQMYKLAQCADVRDKVFGLIGLCSQCCSDNVVVNYQKSPLDTCGMLLEHYLSRHSIHGLNLKNMSNVDLFTLVKEIVVIFSNGGIEIQPSVTADAFPEVFEDPQKESVSMIACVPRRYISLNLQGCFYGPHRSFYDRYSGKSYSFWHLDPATPPNPVHPYWMCKINRLQHLVLRELEDRLYFVGIARELTELGKLKDSNVQAADGASPDQSEQVRSIDKALSKVCLYLDFRALKDICLILNSIYDGSSSCLLLSWNCLSCDYCWNRRHCFALEGRGPLYETDARTIQKIHGTLE